MIDQLISVNNESSDSFSMFVGGGDNVGNDNEGKEKDDLEDEEDYADDKNDASVDDDDSVNDDFNPLIEEQ